MKGCEESYKEKEGCEDGCCARRKEKQWKHAPTSSRGKKRAATSDDAKDSSNLMHSTDSDSSNDQLGGRVYTDINIYI